MSDLIKCHTCLHTFFNSDVVWVRSETEQGTAPLARPTKFQKFMHAAFSDNRTRPIGPSTHDILDRLGDQPRCPECGTTLPNNFQTRKTLVIGLVGQTASAKSHYLAALLHLLDSGELAEHYDLSCVFSADTSERYNSIYAPLFDPEHPVLDATRVLIGGAEWTQPLEFKLTHLRTGRTLNVQIFDGSGEQMRTPQEQAEYSRHLLAAQELLLCVTPAMLKDIRAVLTEQQIATQRASLSIAMFDNLANGIADVTGQPADKPLRGVHTTVLLSKADQLLGIPGFDTSLLEPLEHNPASVEGLADQLMLESAKIADFMGANGGANIVTTVLARYGRVSFLAGSATGCDPVLHDPDNLESGYYPDLTPKRILEPLVMMLHRQGFLAINDLATL